MIGGYESEDDDMHDCLEAFEDGETTKYEQATEVQGVPAYVKGDCSSRSVNDCGLDRESKNIPITEPEGVLVNDDTLDIDVTPSYDQVFDYDTVPQYEQNFAGVKVSDGVFDSLSFLTDGVSSMFSKEKDGHMAGESPGVGNNLRQKAKIGIRRRRRMKEGTLKSLKRAAGGLAQVFLACTLAIGAWAHEVGVEPMKDVCAVFTPSRDLEQRQANSELVDCLELFAGQARVSEAFAKKRRGVLQPRDIRFGHDFRKNQVRDEILHEIKTKRPGMVWMAPPCTYWCGFSRLNFSPQERRRLRAKEQVLIQFVDEVIETQNLLGGMAIVENPRSSDMWRHSALQRWILKPDIHLAKVDLCAYGMVSSDHAVPMRKPLSLLCNNGRFAEHITKLCDHSHEHQTVQGNETAKSAVYPTAFANAVVRAYDAGRTPQFKEVLMTGEVIEDMAPEEPAGADAISFKGKVNPTVASALKRIHQNLGHPNNRDLIKHLRLGGAPASVQRAAEQMSCRTCDRSSKAKLQRVAAPVTMLDFNEAVAADVIWIDAADEKNKPCLNMIDLASTYQVVVPLVSTKSEDLAKAFVNGWISWAGAPKHLLIDLETGFKDKFLTMLDQRCVVVQCAAGQAHWQNGVAERHGGSWKLIWAKLVEDHLVMAEEMDEAIAAVNDSKNQLRNRSGYSPRQWVFGTNKRETADLFDGDHEAAANFAASTDAKFSRTHILRNGARMAFFQVQSKEALSRAVAHKPRVEPRSFEVGELIYIYRETKQGRSKRPTASWVGPAVVIGREGQNYWAARGGRCLLVAPEHAREANHEEVSEMLRLKAAMKELKQFIQAPDDDTYEPIDDGDAPGPLEMEVDDGGSSHQPPRPDSLLDMAANREDMIRTSVRRTKLLDDVPEGIKRARIATPAQASHQAFMMKHCSSAKAQEKQLEKELPWGLIPPDEKPLYIAAEDKQWKEHVDFGAVKPLSIEESERVRRTVDPSRILRSRFAYKDKNHAKRKKDPTLPCRPKARLCVAGQHDPDLGRQDMSVDAPTTGRHSILLALQLALCRGWLVSVGDIRAAFLNGIPAPRQLYFSQPKRGIRSLDPKQLIEVVKGVFGLSTSPKLWWLKLSQDLKTLEIVWKGRTLKVEQNPVDPCVFMFRDFEHDQTLGLLLTHVDDLMLMADGDLSLHIQQKLQERFPVDEWQSGDFEYVGCEYHCAPDEIQIHQSSYVEGRVSKVTIPKDGLVSRDAREENRTSIGSLSWLAKQTRPDLQFAVSQAQKKQNDPNLEDLKATNRAVASASRHQDKGIVLKKMNESDIIFLAYHDPAWGNADVDDGDPQWLGGHQVASQIATLTLLAEKRCLLNQKGKFSVMDWKSKGCQRVCRSTFAGETMACCEATESTIYLRGLYLSMIHGRIIPEAECGRHIEMHFVTDCKSLYDHIHREGVPKAPTEKRLAIDLAGLRQILMVEAEHQWRRLHGQDAKLTPQRPCRPPIHWLPTDEQLADVLTKMMSADEWWNVICAGEIQLPLKLSQANK